MNKLHIHERMCTYRSERVSKCVRWCSQHLSNVHICICMVLTTPVGMHAYSPQKITYALMHACMCNGAEASLSWKLLQTYLESFASIMQAVVCRPLLPHVLPSRPNPSPDAARSRNASKSTLAHDAVNAAVSHKRHSIIRVGAGLIWFVRVASMGRTRAWPQTPFSTKFYFRHGSRGLFAYTSIDRSKNWWDRKNFRVL